jgi:hypothetical protein
MDDRDSTIPAERAIWRLRHASEAAPRERLQGMALQLRLWRYPRSGVYVLWSILLPVRDYRTRKAIVREASWDPSRDRRRGADVEPDIRIRDAEMDWKDLSPFLDQAGGFHSIAAAPMLPGKGSAGLEGSRSLAHVRLEWSGRGPRAWAATIAWVGRFRNLLVLAFQESRPA